MKNILFVCFALLAMTSYGQQKFTIAGGSGGSGTPGGSTTQVQYNNAGAFAGISGATSNGTALRATSPIIITPTIMVANNSTADSILVTEDGVTGSQLMATVSALAVADSLASGRYIPTLAGITNIASVTPVLISYTKVGSEIEVTGVATCTVTTGSGTFSRLSITLPPSFTSNFTLVTDCSGQGVVRTSAANTSAFIETNTSTDVAEVGFYSGSGSHDIHFTFNYKQK